MVGLGDPPPLPDDQSTEEVTQAAEAEIARVARLAQEVDNVVGKRHRD
jgi:hypothetical protein